VTRSGSGALPISPDMRSTLDLTVPPTLLATADDVIE
jgi:hypothetical protein